MGRVGGKNAALPLPLMSVFESACPNYIAMGMTYEQFWDGDVSAHKAYREAKRIRNSEQNAAAWLQGLYIYEALIDITPYLKAFSKGKPKPYPLRPYDLTEQERKEREEREEQERYERVKERIAAFAKAQKERQKKQSEKEVEDSNA